MNDEEEKSLEEMQKELAFYKSQTKVLREKNRDLRNALLVADAKVPEEQPKEAAQDSMSDIRKIIADSKKQISDKLSRFKETVQEAEKENGSPTSAPSVSQTSSTIAPTTPRFSPVLEKETTDGDKLGEQTSSSTISGDTDTLLYQIEYLKNEVERLETFLDQSERVNDRLRQLLTDYNIDVSAISKAIEEVSQTAISGTAVKKLEPSRQPPQPLKDEMQVSRTPEVVSQPKVEPNKATLDPVIENHFKEFSAKVDSGISNEQITMEILEFRERLMDLIPHSRVFYEMQIEYRKWKKGEHSLKNLREAIKEWKATIATTM